MIKALQKGTQHPGMWIATLVQFCKLSSHQRKNDGSNLNSHWPKYSVVWQRLWESPHLCQTKYSERWMSKNMRKRTNAVLHGEVHVADCRSRCRCTSTSTTLTRTSRAKVSFQADGVLIMTVSSPCNDNNRWWPIKHQLERCLPSPGGIVFLWWLWWFWL